MSSLILKKVRLISKAAKPKKRGLTRPTVAETCLHQGLNDSILTHIILRLSTPICYGVGMR